MKTNDMNNYEGMFLMDADEAQFEAVKDRITGLLERSEAELISIKPWDERRLAFKVGARKRGLYVLTYFRCNPARISEIEHDCRLAEEVLRVLVLRRDSISEDEISAPTPATKSSRKRSDRSAGKGESKKEDKPEKKPTATGEAEQAGQEEPTEQKTEAAEEAGQQQKPDKETTGESTGEKAPQSEETGQAVTETAEKPGDEKAEQEK